MPGVSSATRRAEATACNGDVHASSMKKWATPDGWDRYKAEITSMYTQQGKTLKEIMAIMAERGHNGT